MFPGKICSNSEQLAHRNAAKLRNALNFTTVFLGSKTGFSLAYFHIQSKRRFSKRGSSSASLAHFFQKPLLIKTSSLLATKKAHDVAEISLYKA